MGDEHGRAAPPGRGGEALVEVPWDAIGKIIPVVAVLLPVLEVVRRATSFAVSAYPVPAAVAVELPIPQLALGGAWIVVPGVAAAGLASLLGTWAGRRRWRPAQGVRSLGWVLVAVGSLVVIAAALLLVSFVTTLVGVGAGLVSQAWMTRTIRREGRLSFGKLLAFTLGIVIGAAMFAGIAPGGARAGVVADVTLTPPIEAAAGRYVWLGESALAVYLYPCGAAPGRDGLLRVRQEQVASTRVVASGRIHDPSLLEIVTGQRTLSLGFEPACEVP